MCFLYFKEHNCHLVTSVSVLYFWCSVLFLVWYNWYISGAQLSTWAPDIWATRPSCPELSCPGPNLPATPKSGHQNVITKSGICLHFCQLSINFSQFLFYFLDQSKSHLGSDMPIALGLVSSVSLKGCVTNVCFINSSRLPRYAWICSFERGFYAQDMYEICKGLEV